MKNWGWFPALAGTAVLAFVVLGQGSVQGALDERDLTRSFELRDDQERWHAQPAVCLPCPFAEGRTSREVER